MNWAAWGISWLGSWGNSWGPLHEVEEEVIVGGGSKPFNGRIPKTEDDRTESVEVTKELPRFHPWIHSPIVKQYVESVEPEIVEAVIESVAKVAETRTVQNKDLETANAEKVFRSYLAQQKAEWKKEYAQLILLEYERREQEIEDAQIAMLLFDL